MEDTKKDVVEDSVEMEEEVSEQDLQKVMEEYKNRQTIREAIEEGSDEEEEERVITGHKAEAIWEEKNVPRTRKLRNTFHKNEEVAENMALKTIEEYFVNQGKEGIDLEEVEIKLHPIYEE